MFWDWSHEHAYSPNPVPATLQSRFLHPWLFLTFYSQPIIATKHGQRLLAVPTTGATPAVKRILTTCNLGAKINTLRRIYLLFVGKGTKCRPARNQSYDKAAEPGRRLHCNQKPAGGSAALLQIAVRTISVRGTCRK